jgi:hypothetical protein
MTNTEILADVTEMARRLELPVEDVERVARTFEGDTWSFIDNVMDLVAEADPVRNP